MASITPFCYFPFIFLETLVHQLFRFPKRFSKKLCGLSAPDGRFPKPQKHFCKEKRKSVFLNLFLFFSGRVFNGFQGAKTKKSADDVARDDATLGRGIEPEQSGSSFWHVGPTKWSTTFSIRAINMMMMVLSRAKEQSSRATNVKMWLFVSFPPPSSSFFFVFQEFFIFF